MLKCHDSDCAKNFQFRQTHRILCSGLIELPFCPQSHLTFSGAVGRDRIWVADVQCLCHIFGFTLYGCSKLKVYLCESFNSAYDCAHRRLNHLKDLSYYLHGSEKTNPGCLDNM